VTFVLDSVLDRARREIAAEQEIEGELTAIEEGEVVDDPPPSEESS
jgi:hypothetical protein